MKERDIKRMSSSGLIRGSGEYVDSRLRGNDKRREDGRSMVEMLGVLAIVGVLSVGGIMGLRQALTNARANDLIYEANKRATVVSGQLMFSNNNPSLNEFVQNEFSFGTFNSVTPGNGTFTISINGVSESVCAKAQSMVGGMIVNFTPQACSGDDNTVFLTYNNDLSEGESAASSGSSSGSTHAPTKWDGPLTGDGSTCTGSPKGECQICINGSYIDSDAICLNRGGNICVDGVCKSLQPGCMTNGDCPILNPTQCGNGECYCNFKDSLVDACNGPTVSGTCILKSSSLKKTTKIDGHEYVIGEWDHTTLSWFSARNFCAAYDKRMMSLAELGCGDVGSICTNNNGVYATIRGSGKMASWASDVVDCQAPLVQWYTAEVLLYDRNTPAAHVICY